jgi:hypothetical protein
MSSGRKNKTSELREKGAEGAEGCGKVAEVM